MRRPLHFELGWALCDDCGRVAFETEFTEDLKKIDVPTFVAHGTDDQIVPYEDSAPLAVKLLKNGVLKAYPGLPHGLLSTHPDVINPDLLAFVDGKKIEGAD